ncbi:probable 2-oxoglutarate-dependent dioxygenase AOP1 [Ricinus communis]|uniref:2-oxoglutarate-dependent dioxygenase DAO n=1 Tax=Ricinus communis TaxID=3988 RepID=B9RUX4_RICCO|nr:probable 2-oxoglutarate-dependent dioxygenase AOP1 [Ricinus communis]EEF44707.1 Flavonol synthase/flavanone 3-hydroxylase, putative [Ricinus communis]|eukprot:XP_002517543.1 probable 2-oxoglutarate-dependent dioxygenase AOP1 [Ricinus communis]
MSPKTYLAVPVIDFSRLDLNPDNNTEEWESVRTQVVKALEEHGCFKASSNKISLELRQAILSDLEELFALPLENKMRNTSELPNCGYIGKSPFTPLHESLGIIDPITLENVESLTNVLWPGGKPSFSENIQSYSKQILEVEKIIRRMILENLGVDKYLDEHMNSTASSLRVMRYEAPNTTETQLGLAAHTDQGIIAILYQNQIDGLEVETKNGEWANIKLEPDHFLVIFGESFNAWVNGRLYAPFHRVTMIGNEVRYSFGTFSAFKPGYLIKAPEELVDEEHPLQYRPFDFIEVLNRHQAQVQKSSDKVETAIAPLKAYYGV